MPAPPPAASPPDAPRLAASAGFTLIELLAALVVVSLLSLMLLAGFQTGQGAWRRLDGRAAAGEGVARAQALLRWRLEHAVPVTRYDEHPAGPDFEGQPRSAIFLAPSPEAERPGAMRRYQVILSPGGELLLRSVSDLATDPTQWSRAEVLLAGVQSLELSYFGPGPDGSPPAWRPRWLQRPAFPALIRLRARFNDGDARRWPDLVVRPVADTDTDCILDPASGGCRGR